MGWPLGAPRHRSPPRLPPARHAWVCWEGTRIKVSALCQCLLPPAWAAGAQGAVGVPEGPQGGSGLCPAGLLPGVSHALLWRRRLVLSTRAWGEGRWHRGWAALLPPSCPADPLCCRGCGGVRVARLAASGWEGLGVRREVLIHGQRGCWGSPWHPSLVPGLLHASLCPGPCERAVPSWGRGNPGDAHRMPRHDAVLAGCPQPRCSALTRAHCGLQGPPRPPYPGSPARLPQLPSSEHTGKPAMKSGQKPSMAAAAKRVLGYKRTYSINPPGPVPFLPPNPLGRRHAGNAWARA